MPEGIAFSILFCITNIRTFYPKSIRFSTIDFLIKFPLFNIYSVIELPFKKNNNFSYVTFFVVV